MNNHEPHPPDSPFPFRPEHSVSEGEVTADFCTSSGLARSAFEAAGYTCNVFPVCTAIFIFLVSELTHYRYMYRHMHLYSPQITTNLHLPMLPIRLTASIYLYTNIQVHTYTCRWQTVPCVITQMMHPHRCRNVFYIAVNKEREHWP